MADRDIFLPYTAFHAASAVRTLRAGYWTPRSHVVIINGLGTTRTQSGKAYLAAFRKELDLAGVRYSEIGPERPSLAAGFFALLAAASNDRLFTGNPRRTPSLLLAGRVAEIIMLDEGAGTTIWGGYLDPTIPERSRFKRVAVTLGLLPDYREVHARIGMHPTIFVNSIFPNPAPMAFEPILSVKNLGACPSRIFVSSFLRDEQIAPYAAWAKQNFGLGSETVLSVHPQMPRQRAEYLSRLIGIPIFDQGEILLEEYAVSLASSGLEVTILGQENSSTIILKNQNNITVVSHEFYQK